MCICNRHISSAMTLLIMHCFWFRSCLFHGSSDTFTFYRRMYIFQSLWLQACIGDRLCLTAILGDLRACTKTRPTTSAVFTTSRAAVYHPPFLLLCYLATWNGFQLLTISLFQQDWAFGHIVQVSRGSILTKEIRVDARERARHSHDDQGRGSHVDDKDRFLAMMRLAVSKLDRWQISSLGRYIMDLYRPWA